MAYYSMVCIELLGMSRAGKTTQKNSLLEKLNQDGVSAVTLERPKIPFSEFKSTYHFHDFLINYFNENIESNKDKDFIILDRGLYDRQVLLDFDYKDSAISHDEYSILSKKLTEAKVHVDKGYVFMVSPEESIRRWEDQRAQGLDYSHLNKGLNAGDDLTGLQNFHQGYSALLDNPVLEKIEGLDSREYNLNKILGGLKTNDSKE